MFARYININSISSSAPFLVAFIIAVINLRIGAVMSPDSHTYSSYADILINLEFNYFLYFESNSLGRLVPITLPVTLIAILKIISPSGWMEYFIYVNTLFIFITFYFFQKAMQSVKIHNIVIGFCCFLLILSADFLTWPRYILTDTIYASLSFLLIYITMSVKNFDFKKISIWLLCGFLLAFTRPTAMPILAVSIFLMFIYKIKLNPKVMMLMFLISFFSSALIYAVFASNLANNTNLSEGIDHLMNFAKSGVVIHDRPDTYINISNDISGFFKLFCYRFLFFFNPYAQSFSSIHIIFNSFLTLVYLFGLMGTIWNWGVASFEQKQFFLKINLFIFSIAIFHSATLIDFDWRYRFPAIILMMFVGAISMQSLVNSLKAKKFIQN
jgi:hypothetical protein